MNNYTKNDLSAGVVKLDYDALLKTASIAYGKTLNEIREETAKLQDWRVKDTSVYLISERVAILGKQLAVVADTYVALKKGISREDKEMINIEGVFNYDNKV
jgi:hypothetical protein